MIKIFAIDADTGEETEITDLYFFEEQGVRDWKGEARHGKYNFRFEVEHEKLKFKFLVEDGDLKVSYLDIDLGIDIPRLEKEHAENIKNWDVRADLKLLDELPNIKADE